MQFPPKKSGRGSEGGAQEVYSIKHAAFKFTQRTSYIGILLKIIPEISHAFIFITFLPFLFSLLSQSHEIQNLQTYTQYKVTVQVFNPEGLGPETTILVMTDEGGE